MEIMSIFRFGCWILSPSRTFKVTSFTRYIVKTVVTLEIFLVQTPEISVIFYQKFPFRIDFALFVPNSCSFLYKVPTVAMSV